MKVRSGVGLAAAASAFCAASSIVVFASASSSSSHSLSGYALGRKPTACQAVIVLFETPPDWILGLTGFYWIYESSESTGFQLDSRVTGLDSATQLVGTQ